MQHCALILALFLSGFFLSGSSPQKDFSFKKDDLSVLRNADLLNSMLEMEGLVYADHRLEGYLEQIASAILPKGSPPERVKWRFRVLRDPIRNAWAFPNGSVYVTSGMLALLNDEDQLASLLAHEVSHVLHRHAYLHSRSTRKKFMVANITSLVLAAVLSNPSWRKTQWGESNGADRAGSSNGVYSHDLRSQSKTGEGCRARNGLGI